MNTTQQQRNYLRHQFGSDNTAQNIEQSTGFTLTDDERKALKEDTQ